MRSTNTATAIGLQILSVFPAFVLQQTRNSLAVRRLVPLGLGQDRVGVDLLRLHGRR